MKIITRLFNPCCVIKKQAAFILICLSTFFARAQSGFDLYGLCWRDQTPTSMDIAFAKIDSGNGNLTLLSTWKQKSIRALGHNAADPKNRMFYQVTTDSLNLYILKIDMNTGIIMDTVFRQDSLGTGESGIAWITDEVRGLFYNCFDDHIYFSYLIPTKPLDSSQVPGTRLAKIDGVTGKASLVTILPVYTSVGQQYFDMSHQQVFMTGYQNSNILYVYDLPTGKLSSVTLSKKYSIDTHLNLVLNPDDNQLYGMEFYYSYFTSPNYIAKARIVKIDPLSGKVTDLSSLFDCNDQGKVILDPGNRKLYFMGARSNPFAVTFGVFDLNTKMISFHKTDNLPNTFLISGLYGMNTLLPDTAFTCRNFCQHAPTFFSPLTRHGSLEWDFGDPASGSLNTSTQPYPQHIYNAPGTYTVTMMSTNCYGSDTVRKKVVIQRFPQISLGNDTSWCPDKKNTPLNLHVNASNSTYLWQDASTAATYTVTQPGIYWVQVNSSCGYVRDTLVVGSEICPCNVLAAPTITSSTVQFIFDCDVSGYGNLWVEFYNDIGQIVLRKSILQNNDPIHLDEFASGVYFYRVRDESYVIKTGKVVRIR